MAAAKEVGKTVVTEEILCDPCKNADQQEVAVSYCDYCNEYFCKTCHNVHKRLKATKHHLVKEDELNSKRDCRKREIYNFVPVEKCSAHGDFEINQYCVSHKELCCPQCVSTIHKTCKNVQNVTDFLDTFDFQQAENELECKMRHLADEVHKTMYRINESLKVVDYYHSKAQSEMLEVKHSIVDHIESKYKELVEELNKMREADLERILPYKHKCDAVGFDLKTLHLYLSDKKKSSGQKLFFAMKHIDTKISSNVDNLTDIKFMEHFNVSRYQFKSSAGIDDLKSNISTFGSMELNPNVIKTATKVKSLQINDAEDDKYSCITGLTLLPDSRLVLVDNNNSNIKVVDTEEDKVISNQTFESKPWDVTCVTNNKVAVSFPEKNTIEILSLGKNLTFDAADGNTIACTDKCYGITSYKDTIIVTVRQNEETSKIERYELNGSLVLSVEVDLKNPQYVVCNEDETKIYVSDNTRSNHIVELFSGDFTKQDILGKCRDEVTGMTIDKTGVMYYCDSYHHEIDVVYLNKKEQSERERQTLISYTSPGPKCLIFCDETNRLFVGLDGNEISVYEVF